MMNNRKFQSKSVAELPGIHSERGRNIISQRYHHNSRDPREEHLIIQHSVDAKPTKPFIHNSFDSLDENEYSLKNELEDKQ
jgi:hypothetical protein